MDSLRAAFEPDPLSLDALLKESTAYARGVVESLKGQVYDTLKELAQSICMPSSDYSALHT